MVFEYFRERKQQASDRRIKKAGMIRRIQNSNLSDDRKKHAIEEIRRQKKLYIKKGGFIDKFRRRNRAF